MKNQYFITSRLSKKIGMYDFFFNGKNVTGLWMDFFSGLSMEQELSCTKLFIKKYGRKLYEKTN